MQNEITKELKRFSKTIGADLFGVADLNLYDLKKSSMVSFDLIKKYHYAICLGKKLNNEIIDKLEKCPTPEYADHYREVNKFLDEIALKVREWIENKGYHAHIIPASKLIDNKKLEGEVSHKAIARLAGIGWQGKSLLIVNPDCGPRHRLVTILTDMPLVADKPLKNRCGSCTECKDNCPANAIKGVPTKDFYNEREEALNLKGCYDKLCQFKMMDGIDATVCGICVKVCPWGRKSDKR